MSQCPTPLPTTDDKYLGIEFEFYHQNVGDRTYLDLPDDPRYHTLIVNWEFLSPRYGYEMKFLVKESEVDELLPSVIAAIKDFGGTVDQNCGLHVHLDCRNRSKDHVRRVLAYNSRYLRDTFTKRPSHSVRCCSDRGLNTIECCVMESNFDTPRILAYIHKLVELVDTPAEQQKAA